MRRFFGPVLERLVVLSKNLNPRNCRKPKKKLKSRKSKTWVILTVYLNDTQQMLTEVPVTPATRVVDVVEYCKEAGEGECHLAEVWNGNERALPQDILLLDLLQQWGARRPEVSFYLRHCPPWTQGSQQQPQQQQQEQPQQQQPPPEPEPEPSWTTEAAETADDKIVAVLFAVFLGASPRYHASCSQAATVALRHQTHSNKNKNSDGINN
ncbi:uncharacterized protein PAE49_019275 [Odontesthes bonariensis]|uniref:uncharacterized protein LOC142366652 n=1 Tax=Odontesthes bonariensis TaxID=219752 RepID=UPI003F5875C3